MAPAQLLTSAPVTLPGPAPTASLSATATATATAWVRRRSTLAQSARITRWVPSVSLASQVSWGTPEMEELVCLARKSATATPLIASPSTLSIVSGTRRDSCLTFRRRAAAGIGGKRERSVKTFCPSLSLRATEVRKAGRRLSASTAGAGPVVQSVKAATTDDSEDPLFSVCRVVRASATGTATSATP